MSETTLTRNQQLVLDGLVRAGRPLGAYDLLGALRDTGLRAPAQVYRALEKLEEKGFVHRIESLNAYVACEHAEDTGHTGQPVEAGAAFAICDRCGDVQEMVLPQALAAVREWQARAGFSTHHLMLELHGRCADCGAEEARGAHA